LWNSQTDAKTTNPNTSQARMVRGDGRTTEEKAFDRKSQNRKSASRTRKNNKKHSDKTKKRIKWMNASSASKDEVRNALADTLIHLLQNGTAGENNATCIALLLKSKKMCTNDAESQQFLLNKTTECSDK
jgi:hypothetical protein